MQRTFVPACLAAVALAFSSAALAAPTTYIAFMNSAAEENPANLSPGTGFTVVTFDPDADTLRIRGNFQNLQGTTTLAHIHAPTVLPLTGTAGVATQTPSLTGFPLGVTSGTFDTTLNTALASSWNAAYITANGGTPAGAETAFGAALSQGRAYFNIHTSAFGGGEIRGFYVLPEPTGLLGLAALGVVTRRRR